MFDAVFSVDKDEEKFQSYQSRQINPDYGLVTELLNEKLGFNRINQDRSIPT